MDVEKSDIMVNLFQEVKAPVTFFFCLFLMKYYSAFRKLKQFKNEKRSEMMLQSSAAHFNLTKKKGFVASFSKRKHAHVLINEK